MHKMGENLAFQANFRAILYSFQFNPSKQFTTPNFAPFALQVSSKNNQVFG